MIKMHSIKELYPLALAEGEGVGTAYEYFAKRLRLRSWLKVNTPAPRVLIAGLPEKYGSSLDFFLAASEFGADVTVLDDRQESIEKAKTALAAAQNESLLQDINPQFELLKRRDAWSETAGRFDAALSSETLQRLTADGQQAYLSTLMQLANQGAIFAPNGDNPDHTTQSGLSGIGLGELKHIALQAASSCEDEILIQTGYLDMPPFPPGITRSEEQRQQASSGRGEAMAMWALGYYARLEKWFPLSWRKRNAHIVYALFKHTLR